MHKSSTKISNHELKTIFAVVNTRFAAKTKIAIIIHSSVVYSVYYYTKTAVASSEDDFKQFSVFEIFFLSTNL